MKKLIQGLALVAWPVVSFDIDAHDAIGQTCASAMDQNAVKQVKRLLGGQDASDVAGWGHEVDNTYPDMARLHFQVHDDSTEPFCGAAETRKTKCEDNICLLQSIKHFYGKVLADEGRKTDFPQIDYTKVAKGITFTDADSVKMLINLIGDLHQPMHVGFAGDDMGRKVQVKFRGQDRTMSLYDVWDKGISEAVRTQESSFWLGGWTHVRAVSSEFARDTELWKKDGAEKSFDRWLSESVDFACSKAYTHPTTGKRLAGPGAEAGPVVIDEAAYQVWRELWLKQILIAGERTAIVMNDILDAQGASKLGTAQGVKTDADSERAKEKAEWEKERVKRQKDEKSSRSSGPSFNPSVFFKNLSIAVVTVPLVILAANHGLNPYTYTSLIRTLLESSNGSASSSGPRNPGKRFE